MRFPFALSTAIALAGGAAMLASSGQDRPGLMTQARVWIENRGQSEAIPVVLQETGTVQLVGAPAVTLAPASVVQAHRVRQNWEYRTVRVASGQDLAQALASLGNDGWEATGVQYEDASARVVLLKRPK